MVLETLTKLVVTKLDYFEKFPFAPKIGEMGQ